MSDVVGFIRARLDEHRVVARRAIGINGASAVALHLRREPVAANYPLPVWQYDAGQVWQHADDRVGGPTLVVGKTWDADGQHIAMHDPVHVLAWVAALTAVLDLAECAACQIEHQSCDHRDDTLRAFAAIWRDHPDYDPTWDTA